MEGEIFFSGGYRIRLREELDFDEILITSFPHHKHIPPNIKRHRILAPDLSFITPNLPFLIQEVEELIFSKK